MEFARFGRLTVGRSVATPEQWHATHEKMAQEFPRLVAELDALVLSIAERVSQHRADRLLQRGWWELAGAVIKSNDGDASDSDLALAHRMVDYIQSIVASVQPASTDATEISDEDWAQLTEDVSTLFSRVSLEYQMCHTAYSRANDPSFDMELEEFRVRAEMLWMNVRGERYQTHERQALLDILEPHSDIIERLFQIDAVTLANEFEKLLVTHTRGLHDAIQGLKTFQTDVMTRASELAVATGASDLDAVMQEVLKDPEMARRSEEVKGRLFGLDLYDVRKLTRLPTALLDELTWSPGEDTTFFAPGGFRGWPQRVWPTMKRPFIRLNDRVLSFDSFSLFDNFYRVLQRIVFRLAPEYKPVWNERQKAVSEELPFRYLLRLLPNATTFRPVYYRWSTAGGQTQWHECDGLLIFEDHLFVIEVKAGAFTYTSPTTDLQAHLDSLQNLVQAPAVQGNRFVDYLESSPEVALFDAEHRETGRLRAKDFRHITICSITLDAFTELAARSQHLRKVGIELGRRPVWVLSIDDLRVYADLFDNPLVFLHFVEQRQQGAASELIDVNDEMDHLGLYLRENHYTSYASHLMSGEPTERQHLTFEGYRTPVDGYYSALLRGESPDKPRQKLPPRLAEIVQWLGTSSKTHRSQLVSFLLDANSRYRWTISDIIEEQLRDHRTLGRTKPMSWHGGHGCTLWVWSPHAPRMADLAENHTLSVMSAAGEDIRFVIELEYDTTDRLADVHWCYLSLKDLSQSELHRIHDAGEALARRRVNLALRDGKIGPNEPCPCGSGKKYKKCHRP